MTNIFKALAPVLFTLVSGSLLHAVDHSPNQFEHHPDIEIELYAKEPQIIDPVCVAFAANGDCFVVEMRDYPYGFGNGRRPGGTIRLLRDTNQDGRADSSRIFAEGLSFPTSVMPWRDGIMVLAPPQILHLKDTDGDGKADTKTIVLDGLKLGVTDSNANSLRFGVDGLVHVANGGNGGTVWLNSKPDQRTPLGNWDFAIDFENERILKTGETGGGFGLVFDDSGNSFTTYNIDYLQQRVIPFASIENNPEVFPFDATENISDHGESARIFPVVKAETRVNHPEQAGHFSSAGGMGLLERGPLARRLGRSIFVCDVVCNLVHRDQLRVDGAAFRASRAPEESDREFIASRDPACRPIGLEHGPDGALYLVDMQRDVIEHPDYIPQRVLKNMNVRGGDDRGRIYRITPKGESPSSFEQLDGASSQRLVELLASEHRWQVETAHRLLADRKNEASEIFAKILQQLWATDSGGDSSKDAARVRSLWLLKHFETLTPSIVEDALIHRSPMVRIAAIQLAPDRDHAAMLQDSDGRVRFHAALSLDGIESKQKLQELSRLYLKSDDKWMRRATLLAVDDQADQLLKRTVKAVLEKAVYRAADRDAIREVANVVAAGLPGDRHAEFANWFAGELSLNHAAVPELVSGLSAGWKRRPQKKLPASFLKPIVDEWFGQERRTVAGVEILDLMTTCGISPPAQMDPWVNAAISRATDPRVTPQDRRYAIDIASRAAGLGSNRDQVLKVLVGVIESNATAELQRAAIDGLARMQEPSLAKIVCERWSSISPSNRRDLINLLLSRRKYHSELLAAIENGAVTVGELNLDLEQRRTLLRWSSDAIGLRAAKLFGDEEYSNRKAVVTEWLAKLPDVGDAKRGRTTYQKKCATCHVSRGEGYRVGPDLQALAHRSVEDLLTHILDPNMSINPNYVTCVVQTVDGQIIDGLLKQENTESVTLMQADAKEQTIPRSQIEAFQTLPTSLMPEGLEKDLTPADLRSLIAYIQEKP